MRTKDEGKQEALFRATVKLVNEIGFVSSSVSKIAKEAGVSPATLYIYYKNKDDLLVSTYIAIKRAMSGALLSGFDDSRPVRDILETVWRNTFGFTSEHPDYFQFAEQFSNSPYSSLVDQDVVEKYFEPIFKVVQGGIEQKIIKDVDFDILAAFMFHPVIALSKRHICRKAALTDEVLEIAFTLSWDAIKL